MGNPARHLDGVSNRRSTHGRLKAMAGGMPSSHRPGRLPLSARPVVPPPGGPATNRPAMGIPAHPGARLPAVGPGARHCWVVDSDLAPGRWPGILMEWQRTPHGWCGRVVLVVPGDAGPVLMEAWFPAGLLRPAGA